MAFFPFTTLSNFATVTPSASVKIPIAATSAALDRVSFFKFADYRPFIGLVHQVLVHKSSFFARFICFHSDHSYASRMVMKLVPKVART